jgi:hypothetical protein
MSHRQVKKIVAREVKEKVKEEEEDEEPEVKKNFFADVDVDDIESEEDEEKLQVPQKNLEKKKNQKKSNKKEQVKNFNLDDFVFEEHPVTSQPFPETAKVESVFRRQKKYFDSRTETDKLFKNSKKTQKSLHQSGKGLSLTPSFTSYQKVDYLLSMEKVSDPTRNIFFFDLSKGYSKLHPNYIECIESSDVNMLNQFLARYPFHIESLFQMIMVFQMQGNFEHVGSLLERLLYSFQLSFHFQFSVISNDAEIDITMNGFNKIFMRTLFMHADCLGRKGCVRTALEVVKLIFSLDPRNDPLGCIFLVDYYSIRARKFKYFFHFLQNFMSEVHGLGNTLVFPHLIYSLALAKALQTGYFGCSESDRQVAESITSSIELFDKNSSVVLLCAVNWHPEYVAALEQKLAPSDKKLEEIPKVCEIYARRTEDLWKPYLNWLKTIKNTQINISAAERADDLLEKYSKLDSNDFSFDVRTVIPQDMEIQQNRQQGNLNINSSPWYLFFATFLPWNYID